MAGPLLTKSPLFTIRSLRKEHWFYYYHRNKVVCFHTTMRGELVFAPQEAESQQHKPTNLFLGSKQQVRLWLFWGN